MVIVFVDIYGWCCQYVGGVCRMLLFNKVGSRAQARLHQEMSICMGAREVYMYEEGVRHGF